MLAVGGAVGGVFYVDCLVGHRIEDPYVDAEMALALREAVERILANAEGQESRINTPDERVS